MQVSLDEITHRTTRKRCFRRGCIPEVGPNAVEQVRVAGAQVLGEELQLGGGIAVALLVPHKRELDLSGRPLHSHLSRH